MKPKLTPWIGMIVTLLSLAGSMPAEAQIGRLGRAVQERVQNAAAREITGQAGPVYNADVLEMTPEVLDRLVRALAAEETKRREVAAVLARRQEQEQAQAAQRTREDQWQSCNERVRSRPEFRKRADELQARAEALAEQVRTGKLDVQGANRASMELAAAMMALENDAQEVVTKECGPLPGSEAAPSSPDSPLDESRLRRQPIEQALEEGSFTERQYAILKERIPVFCGSGMGAGGEAGARIPGSDGKFYVFSPAEVQALQPRCAVLSERLRAVL